MTDSVSGYSGMDNPSSSTPHNSEPMAERATGVDFLRIAEDTREAIVVVDSEFRYCYVNRQAERILGRVRADLLGRNMWEVFPVTVAGSFHRNHLRALQERVTVSFEEVYEPLGRRLMVRIVPCIVQSGIYGDSNGLTIYFEDVTAQRIAEAGQRETLVLLEAVAQGTTDAVFIKDREGRYVLANPGVSRVFGRPVDEILGRTDADLQPPDIAEQLRRNDLEIMASGRTQVVEEKVHEQPGSSRIYQATKSPYRRPGTDEVIGIIGIGRDVTEQRYIEQEIARRERDYAALVDNAPDVLARFDREMRFLYINRQAERNTGIPAAAYLGKTFREIGGLPEGNVRQWEEAVARVLKTAEPDRIEYSYPTPQGFGYFECLLTPEIDEQGNVETIVTITRDITDRKMLEQERDAQQQAQRRFLREMLSSMTEGRLCLCDTTADLPASLPSFPADGTMLPLTAHTMRLLRHRVEDATRAAQIPQERGEDLVTAVGEASLNAVVHGGGGQGSVHADLQRGIVQVWVQDTGAGISQEALHRATLERGYTTAGTLGHGFYMILKTADRVYLLTGAGGTTVVVEQERTPPDPAWLRDHKI